MKIEAKYSLLGKISEAVMRRRYTVVDVLTIAYISVLIYAGEYIWAILVTPIVIILTGIFIRLTANKRVGYCAWEFNNLSDRMNMSDLKFDESSDRRKEND